MPHRKKTILHVDDDEANRYAVTRSLLKAGFQVIEAKTGQEALNKIVQKPELVILDIRLPDMDGYEVCRRIKADPITAHIPVLHLSANFVSGEDKAFGLNSGADGYLIRPVEPVELVATVNALLRAKQSEEALRESEEKNRLLVQDLQKAAAERETLLKSEQDARAAAEFAGNAKDEFLATLSHELRTPLNAILGWSSLLRGPQTTDEDYREGLVIIERNARSQAQIIEDLLDMSRIVSGKVRLDVKRVDLVAVVQAAVDTVKPTADAKGVQLISKLDSFSGTISGDSNRLQQVIWNLLTNAIKFTSKDGTVVVQLKYANHFLKLSVTDSGEGIRPEFLPHVFERFRQADASTTRRHGGLGLGLAIVKQLIELHGGSVQAHSDGPGFGSIFTVSLPTIGDFSPADHHNDSVRSPLAPPTATIGSPAVDIGGVKILVIDDEADARSFVQRLLEGCGAEVFVAGSAAEAMKSLQAQKPNVIISDIGMSEEDGYTLIKRIRSLPPEEGGSIPAIALTAYARSEDRTRSIISGFQMHLSKPVEPTELIAMIASLAGRRAVEITTP